MKISKLRIFFFHFCIKHVFGAKIIREGHANKHFSLFIFVLSIARYVLEYWAFMKVFVLFKESNYIENKYKSLNTASGSVLFFKTTNWEV